MTSVNLQLQFTPQSVRDTAALFVAGGDPHRWIDCAIRLQVPHERLRFLAVPRSKTDLEPCGGLIFLDAAKGDAKLGSHAPFASSAPFGVIAHRLYLPVEAQLWPQVSVAEMQQLLTGSYLYVWHPALGLSAFEQTDALQMRDLLTAPTLSKGRWNAAQPGLAVSRRLESLTPAEMPTLDTIIAEAKGDIGSSGDDISELPPAEDEPKSDGFNNALRQGKGVVAKFVRWLAQRGPATESSGEPTWMDRVERWAEEKLSQVTAELEAQRNKEIHRLLDLLANDPDQGLRFALPLGGDAMRGTAPPGGRLPERNTNFSLNRLGGGVAGDAWDLSPEYQYQLVERYRELANREIRLGRHRRAAYIFAELLADFQAAAGALVDGRHWREAAVIYRDRLNRPSDAARCLEQGGLWIEAIEQYEELSEYEKAGDLYLKIGQENKARERFLEAADRLRFKGDYLSAARVQEDKLQDIDAAVGVLEGAWPATRQAAQCLQKLFEVLGRHGRHQETRSKLHTYRNQDLSEREGVQLVEILASAARSYPDKTVRTSAADCARVRVSRQLPANEEITRALVAAVTRLAPDDRLLDRDGRRYIQQQTNAITKQSASREIRKGPKRIRTIQLPGSHVNWERAVCSGEQIFVAGRIDATIYLQRASWNQVVGAAQFWQTEPGLSDWPLLLAANANNHSRVLLHQCGGPLLAEHAFPATDNFAIETQAGGIRGMPIDVVAAVRADHGMTWLVALHDDYWTLIALGPKGEQISTQTLFASPMTDDFLSLVPLPMHCRNDKVYVGFRNQMLIYEKAKPLTTITRPDTIRGFAGSAANTRNRLAVTFDVGGVLYWDELDEFHPFAHNMQRPVAAINRGGYLIAASDGYCEVYTTQNYKVKLVAEIKSSVKNPIAVVTGRRVDQFAIVSQDGEIAIFEMP